MTKNFFGSVLTISNLGETLMTDSQSFKPGDVVLLKSGGPRMTVDFMENGRVCCSWLDKNKRYQEYFLVETLTTPPPPSYPRAVNLVPGRMR
jgi:uncharacterized protein YodC (DUF2158 family)